jgi:hypothetical protein
VKGSYLLFGISREVGAHTGIFIFRYNCVTLEAGMNCRGEKRVGKYLSHALKTGLENAGTKRK